jgi:predicted nucleic acid-binding protein
MDASALFLWLTGEAGVADAGVVWLIPSFAEVELTNILWKSTRSGRLSRREAEVLRENFAELPLEKVESSSLLDDAWTLSLSTGLTVYDSLYAALASARGATLVTADRKLANKAVVAGIQVQLVSLPPSIG